MYDTFLDKKKKSKFATLGIIIVWLCPNIPTVCIFHILYLTLM